MEIVSFVGEDTNKGRRGAWCTEAALRFNRAQDHINVCTSILLSCHTDCKFPLLVSPPTRIFSTNKNFPGQQELWNLLIKILRLVLLLILARPVRFFRFRLNNILLVNRSCLLYLAISKFYANVCIKTVVSALKCTLRRFFEQLLHTFIQYFHPLNSLTTTFGQLIITISNTAIKTASKI